MNKKIHIASRGMGNIDKDGNITDFKLLSYDLVTPSNGIFIKPKQK